jgi:hypothetical protein
MAASTFFCKLIGILPNREDANGSAARNASRRKA